MAVEPEQGYEKPTNRGAFVARRAPSDVLPQTHLSSIITYS